MALYALLVAIDAYVPPVNALYGSRNDATAFEAYLRARGGDDLALKTLHDTEATRAAIIDALRTHLGAAGEGDVALFFYAGHGSQEPAPPEIAHLEPSGMIQTLIAHDSFRRIDGNSLVRPIADKELGMLIADVAAGGAHVVVVLDCCNSGHGTRDIDVGVRAWVPDPETVDAQWRDLAAELALPRPLDQFLPGTVERWSRAPAPHVAISACRSDEKAKEYRAGEMMRGAFSRSFVETLDTLGPRSTYRSVLESARARVERAVREQVPQLFPSEAGSLGDGRFLDGAIVPSPPAFAMTKTDDGWEISAGLIHGLRPPDGDEAYLLRCEAPDGEHGGPGGLVRVTSVEPATATVEPIEWTPADIAYRAYVVAVPLPPVEVALAAGTGATAVADAVRQRIETAGVDGQPSPHVRVVAAGSPDSGAVRLRVDVKEPNEATIVSLDGAALVPPVAVRSDGDAAEVVATLEHIARWEQVRGLCGHPSPLADAATIKLMPAPSADAVRSEAGAPLDSVGGYRVEYTKAPDGTWCVPHIFVDVVNTADEDLFVAVIDLTDRFRCHVVYPTAKLAAGHTAALWTGAAIPVELPEGRAVVPGAAARDWLQIIVSDSDFDAHAFELAQLGEPLAPTTRASPTGTLERLAARAVQRDIGAKPPAAAARWSVSAVAVETVVPNA